MSVFDIANSLDIQTLFNGRFTTNGTVFTVSANLSAFDPGFFIVPQITSLGEGTFVFSLQESPDGAVWTDIPVEKLNDPGGLGIITLNAELIDGESQPRLGAFSTDTFIRVKIVASGTEFLTDVSIIIVKSPEVT